MDLIVIAGFLGSGKTSLLLPLARRLSQAGSRLAVVENEVGKIGVDDQVLKAEGLRVREIYSGCVCCSLRGDLVQALLELERSWNPDVVLLEPSGVAGPDQVRDAFVGYGGNLGCRLVIVVLDATRAPLLQSGYLPLVRRGVEAADVLVVNKCDAAAPGAADDLACWAHAIRPRVPVLAVSAQTGAGLEALSEQVAAARSAALRTPASAPAGDAPQRHDHTHKDAAVFAFRRKLCWPEPLAAADLQGRLATLLQSLAAAAAGAESSLPGHIKAVFRPTDGAGYLLLSMTAADRPPQPRGRLGTHVKQGELTVNAILFGTTRARLSRLFNERVPLLGANSRNLPA